MILLKCTGCGEYTLDEVHSCGQKAVSPKPAKYSPDDRYAKYRRIAKKRQGLL